MKTKQTEKEMLEQAIEKLCELLPEQPKIDYAHRKGTKDEPPTPRVRIGDKGHETWLTVVIRPVITKADAAMLIYFKIADYMLFVTRFINDKTAEVLRENGINFIDTAGNAYINIPSQYIRVTGKQRPKTAAFNPKGVFNPAGLRIIYTFLCFAGLEQKPYRTIAHTAGVALGAVGGYMQALREEGYLLDLGDKGLNLMKRKALFHRWVIEYPERLKPKLMLGRYTGPDNWLDEAKFDPAIAQWGGEVAAAKLTDYLKPQTATVYLKQEALNDFLLKNRLRKDPNGDIEIIELFWNEPGDTVPGETVNPILVYADILATGDQRNTETAKVIYDKYIAEHIGQD